MHNYVNVGFLGFLLLLRFFIEGTQSGEEELKDLLEFLCFCLHSADLLAGLICPEGNRKGHSGMPCNSTDTAIVMSVTFKEYQNQSQAVI